MKKSLENIVQKWEWVGNQHFLLLSQCFSMLSKISFELNLHMSSAYAFILDNFKKKFIWLRDKCFYVFTDVPEAPVGPVKISDVTKDSVTLSWQPPNTDGGSEVTGYLIEQRDTRRTAWIKSGTVDKNKTTFTPTKLIEDNEYIFRIIAENAEGQSAPLESSAVTPKSPKSK